MKLLNNKIIFYFLFFCFINSYLVADVGYFIGSFDPPTLAHKESVLRAMEAHDLEKVYITVNHNTAKDYYTSVDERIDMLRILLKDQADRVFILREPLEGRFFFAEELLKKYQGQKVIGIFGDDTFEKNFAIFQLLPNFDYIRIARPELRESGSHYQPVHSSNGEPNIYELEISSNGISSTQARELIQEGNKDNLQRFLDLDIIHYIEQRELYLSTRLTEQDTFLARFYSFLDTVQEKMPHLNLLEVPEPYYKPTQSYAAQSDKFIRQVVETKNMDLEIQFLFRPIAEEILNIPSRSAPFHALQTVGFFPGSFDFISSAQIEVIKQSLEQLHLDQVCLIVLETSRKPIEHSLEERIAKAKEALVEFGNKIRIISAPNLDSLKETTESLAQEYENPSFMILGSNVFESNYEKLRSIPNLQFAVVPYPEDDHKIYPDGVIILMQKQMTCP